MINNDHISSLGYRLEVTAGVEQVNPLLKACGLMTIADADSKIWKACQYLVACTMAGGVAACVGWTLNQDGASAVLHSLAVAPSSRGSGVGASLLGTAMALILNEGSIETIHLSTTGARRFFGGFGFIVEEREALAPQVAAHPAFTDNQSTVMTRRYGAPRHGLDQCAFRLVHNTTENATLPTGSVFLFHQAGSVLESSYRGGNVLRGHLMGAFDGQELRFLWHHYTTAGELMHGEGQILVEALPDGRRELREKPSVPDSDGDDAPGELLLREV